MNDLVRDRDLRAEGTSSIKAKAHARPSKVSPNKYLGVAVAYKGRKVITRVMITERWLPFLECLSMCSCPCCKSFWCIMSSNMHNIISPTVQMGKLR